MGHIFYYWHLFDLVIDLSLQFVASWCLLKNKKLLFEKKPVAWLWAILGMILFYPFVLKHDLYIATTYNSAFIVMQAYGYFLTRKISKRVPPNILKGIKIFFIIFAFIMCIVIFCLTGTKNFGILQFLQAATGLFASLLLTFPNPKSRIKGWYSMGFSNFFCICHVLGNHGYIIAYFQWRSIKYARMAITEEKKLAPKDVKTLQEL